jgi:hypothetical protein
MPSNEQLWNIAYNVRTQAAVPDVHWGTQPVENTTSVRFLGLHQHRTDCKGLAHWLNN